MAAVQTFSLRFSVSAEQSMHNVAHCYVMNTTIHFIWNIVCKFVTQMATFRIFYLHRIFLIYTKCALK